MKLVKLTQNKEAFVDDEDYEYISKWKWYYKQGYACRNIPDNGKQKTVLMHTCIIHCPMYKDIDHINRNKLDNRKSNLRIATRSQNCANMKKDDNCKSIYKGVTWHSINNKWRARIGVNYKRIHLGLFENEIDAAKAYNDAAKKYFGKYALLNKI